MLGAHSHFKIPSLTAPTCGSSPWSLFLPNSEVPPVLHPPRDHPVIGSREEQRRSYIHVTQSWDLINHSLRATLNCEHSQWQWVVEIPFRTLTSVGSSCCDHVRGPISRRFHATWSTSFSSVMSLRSPHIIPLGILITYEYHSLVWDIWHVYSISEFTTGPLLSSRAQSFKWTITKQSLSSSFIPINQEVVRGQEATHDNQNVVLRHHRCPQHIKHVWRKQTMVKRWEAYPSTCTTSTQCTTYWWAQGAAVPTPCVRAVCAVWEGAKRGRVLSGWGSLAHWRAPGLPAMDTSTPWRPSRATPCHAPVPHVIIALFIAPHCAPTCTT